MSINVNDKNLGHATAYAYYKAGGGTMTEAEFTEFMADFGTASQTAVEAAQAALASKNTAQTAATTATTKASEATTAATTATSKAAEASTSASTATSAKDTAVSASQTATTKASEATTAAATATSAKTDAVAANTAAQSAKTAAQTAQTGAETAAASVQSSAAQIATNAEDISQLKSDLGEVADATTVPTVNLFNVAKAVHGEINSNGTLYYGESTVYSLSDYIDVSDLTEVKLLRLTNGVVQGVNCYYTLYDSNKALIGGRNIGNTADVSNASYIIANPQQAFQDSFMVCSSDSVPTAYVPYGFEFKYLDEINKIKKVAYVGSGQEYTSLLRALKYSDADTIIVNSGTYNVVNEYKAEYGNSFWDNYNGYADSTDDFMKGLWVKNREVILSPNAKVLFDYDGDNTAVGSGFSIFAVSKNAKIQGGYLQAVNLPNANNAMLRYFIHDDFENWLEGTNEYDGIIFDGSVRSSAVIGAGCGIHNRYIIRNCVFLNNSRPYDISYHNNGSDGVNFIDVHGCYGNSVCAFRWYGTGTSLTHCIAHDNHFSKIECVAHTTTPNENENMVLHAWNNVVES